VGLPTIPIPHAAEIMRSRSYRNYADPRGVFYFGQNIIQTRLGRGLLPLHVIGDVGEQPLVLSEAPSQLPYIPGPWVAPRHPCALPPRHSASLWNAALNTDKPFVMNESVAAFSVEVIVIGAVGKLLEGKAINAGCLCERNDLLFRIERGQENLGLLFSAAGQFGHKPEPCRFGLCEENGQIAKCLT
jgi:hypothetical protein